MKSSWISCAGLEIWLLLALALVAPISAKRKNPAAEDLTNFLLSPRYSQWLVGPISHLATEEEMETYLHLTIDEEAAAFIASFWAERGGSSVIPGQGPRAIFDSRAAEADRLFGDGTNKGHRTDRGTVYVLYGEPVEIRFDPAPKGRGEYVETWEYDSDTGKGLDGKEPDRIYRFVNKDGQTVLYRGPLTRQVPRTGIRQ